MFQTQSFQAFNTFSLANLTCTLKLNQTQSHLSHIALDYHIGITDKYRLSIYENDLSYDMKFVVNNLKGFFEYLKSVHENSNFKLCEFAKNKVTVSFLLKIFNQEQKVIKQQFQSTVINDQVIWKSDLKSKMDQLQLTLTKNISSEINRKIKDHISEQKQMSLMKISALDKKVTRQLENINKKIEMVVNLINNDSVSKSEVTNRTIRHRGRFQEQSSHIKKNISLNNDSPNRRLLRRQVEKTKLISKPQQQKLHAQLSQKNPINNLLNKNLDHNEDRLRRRVYQQKIEDLQKQYQFADFNTQKNPQVRKISSMNGQNQPKIKSFFQKSQNPNKNKQTSNQPFLIQKVNITKNEIYNTPKKTNYKETKPIIQLSSSIIKDSKKQHLSKYHQINSKQKQDHLSLKVNENTLMIDQRDELSQKNGLKKMNQSKLESQESSHDLRNKFFQKNMKKTQIIDLEDEQQMKKFKIKIVSQIQNHQNQNEKIKKEQGKQSSIKTITQQIDKINPSLSAINKQNKPQNKKSFKQNLNFIDRIMNQDSDQSNQIIPQGNQQDSSSQELNKMARIVQSYKKNKLEIKMISNQQNQTLKNPLKLSESGLKNEDNTLNELIDPSKQINFQQITPAKIPSYDFLDKINHFVPKVYPKDGKTKLFKYNLKDYFTFDLEGKKIKKISTYLRSGKNYISLVGLQSFPITGRYYMALRILKSQNYHICIGIVDMPSQIKVNQIPKNCDAIYVLDGGLHDEKGGSSRQNGWRSKEGKPVDVLKMELLVEKGEFYVITIVDMDKEEIQFYYNEEFISKTKFSSFCRRNKKRIHPYIALKNQKDCIEIV